MVGLPGRPPLIPRSLLWFASVYVFPADSVTKHNDQRFDCAYGACVVFVDCCWCCTVSFFLFWWLLSLRHGVVDGGQLAEAEDTELVWCLDMRMKVDFLVLLVLRGHVWYLG